MTWGTALALLTLTGTLSDPDSPETGTMLNLDQRALHNPATSHLGKCQRARLEPLRVLSAWTAKWAMLATLAVSVLGQATASASAEPAERQALDFFRGEQRRLFSLMAKVDKGDASARAALDSALNGLIDFDTIARRSLGKRWETRSAAEQAEFSKLLRSLVETNYRRSIRSTINYAIAYKTSAPTASGEIRVNTEARSKQNRRAVPVSIDYLLTSTAESASAAKKPWQVTDVITDGVSMVDNYETQFGRILDKDGYATLIEKMQKKLSELQD